MQAGERRSPPETDRPSLEEEVAAAEAAAPLLARESAAALGRLSAAAFDAACDEMLVRLDAQDDDSASALRTVKHMLAGPGKRKRRR